MALLVKPGMKVINVGTQSGMEAMRFGHIIGPSGKMHLFEVNPISYNLVLKNVYLNNMQDYVHVYHVGAGTTFSKQT